MTTQTEATSTTADNNNIEVHGEMRRIGLQFEGHDDPYQYGCHQYSPSSSLPSRPTLPTLPQLLRVSADTVTYPRHRLSPDGAVAVAARPLKWKSRNIPREVKKPSETAGDGPEASADRYPLSIDTTFWTVIDDHRGEHCRPVPRHFFANPPVSVFIRAAVFMPATGELLWAHIRPGSKTIEQHRGGGRGRKTQVRDEQLWISFPGASEEKTTLYAKLVSLVGAFRSVGGLRDSREMMLTISRRDFRYMATVANGELVLCCFSEAFRLVILARDQVAQVNGLIGWIIDKFLCNGGQVYSPSKLKKFQVDESEIDGLKELYEMDAGASGQPPARYSSKRSIETEPYKDVLFNFRKMIITAAHGILRREEEDEELNIGDCATVKRAIEEYRRLAEKFQVDRHLGWTDPAWRRPAVMRQMGVRSNDEESLMLYSALYNEWIQVMQTYQNESLFTYKFGCNQTGTIKREDVRYYSVTRISGLCSLTVQLFGGQPSVHFQCANKLMHNRLVSAFANWLGKIVVVPSSAELAVAERQLTTTLPDAQWPVFWCTKKRSKDVDTLKMIAEEGKRMATRLMDRLAVDLVVDRGYDVKRRKADYWTLQKQFGREDAEKKKKLLSSGQKKSWIVRSGSVESLEQLQWRFGLFEAPL